MRLVSAKLIRSCCSRRWTSAERRDTRITAPAAVQPDNRRTPASHGAVDRGGSGGRAVRLRMAARAAAAPALALESQTPVHSGTREAGPTPGAAAAVLRTRRDGFLYDRRSAESGRRAAPDRVRLPRAAIPS